MLSSSLTLQQLVSSCSTNDSARLILIQRPSCSLLKQRRLASSSIDDATLYRKARVRTPSQKAYRETTGGIALLLYLSIEFSNKKYGVVWVETTSSIASAVPVSFRVVHTSRNPLGWDNDTTAQATPDEDTLESLESLACAVENALSEKEESSCVVVESLTPLLLRHGFAATMQWIRRLLLRNIVIASICEELLSRKQLLALQDECSACLMLREGEATLVRQGGRERGNVLRQTLPFELKKTDSDSFVSLVLKDDDDATSSFAVIEPQTEETKQEAAPQRETSSRPTSQVLHHDDGARNPPPSSQHQPQPNIFLQDDDPEFDDLDEEDPDDDLDI